MEDFADVLKKYKGKTLMVIFPHPDDESMMTGGLLCLASKLGLRTVVVTLTKGGAGKIHIHPKGLSACEVRERELKNACDYLGVRKLIIGNFSDGKLKGEKNIWTRWLEEIVSNENPSMVVTYDFSGLTGHPDHIALSETIFKILKKRKMNQVTLYWVSLNERLKSWFVPKEVEQNFQKPTHILDFGSLWVKKWLAVKAHRSQRYAQIKITFPLWIFLSKYHYEWYHKVDFKRQYKVKYVDFEI